MTPIALGGWLGALNVLFSAIAIALSSSGHTHGCGRSHSLELGQFVLFVCLLPGIIVGCWIGALAHDMRSEPRWHRLFVMFGICVAFVGLLGGWGEVDRMIGPVLIPSAVGCLILERRTRAPAEDSLPTAAIT